MRDANPETASKDDLVMLQLVIFSLVQGLSKLPPLLPTPVLSARNSHILLTQDLKQCQG